MISDCWYLLSCSCAGTVLSYWEGGGQVLSFRKSGSSQAMEVWIINEMPVHREKGAESRLQNWLAQYKCYSLCHVNSKGDCGHGEEEWGAVCLNRSNLEVLIWSLMAKGKCLQKRLVALVHPPPTPGALGPRRAARARSWAQSPTDRGRSSPAAGWEAQLRTGMLLIANEWIHHRFACVLPAGLSFSSCADAANSDLTESPNYSAFNENWSIASPVLVWEQEEAVTTSRGLLPNSQITWWSLVLLSPLWKFCCWVFHQSFRIASALSP